MILTGQAASSSTAASSFATIPPGACHVVLSNAGPATASVGPVPGSGQALLAGNGLLVLPGAAPTMFATFPDSKGTGLSFCTTANGSTATISWLISTSA
jgi:hypothetical protein